MRRYLGTAYDKCQVTACVVLLLILIWYITAAEDVYIVTAALAIVFILILLFKRADLYFSWAELDEKGIEIKSLLRRSYRLEYSECVDIDVFSYNFGRGISIISRYIFLSNEKAEDKSNIFKSSLRCESYVKIGFNEKTYYYLRKAMPDKQAEMLKEVCKSAPSLKKYRLK